jgi:hypothetical protein
MNAQSMFEKCDIHVIIADRNSHVIVGRRNNPVIITILVMVWRVARSPTRSSGGHFPAMPRLRVAAAPKLPGLRKNLPPGKVP